MKKRSTFILVLLSIMLVSLGFSSGIDGIEWGTTIEEVKRSLGEKDISEEYNQKLGHCILSVDDEVLGRDCILQYQFIDGNLFATTMYFVHNKLSFESLYSIYDQLYNIVSEKYGKPDREFDNFTDDQTIDESIKTATKKQKEDLIYAGKYSPFTYWDIDESEFTYSPIKRTMIILQALLSDELPSTVLINLTYTNPHMLETMLGRGS